MRIGIDFDNTIICYDEVFCELAKAENLISANDPVSKREVRDHIQKLPEGDLIWQRLQGKAYGEHINKAKIFAGFKEFVAVCNAQNIPIFIVSHKTEFGHFDENRIPLREASKQWMHQQGLFSTSAPYILEEHVYFETTREEKIARIKLLQCTHFIDDLVEVLNAPEFPENIARFLFQPHVNHLQQNILKPYADWNEIQHALFYS